MRMYSRFLMVAAIVTLFLFVIFSHIDSHVGSGISSYLTEIPRSESIDISLARDMEAVTPYIDDVDTTTQPTTAKPTEKHEGKLTKLEKHEKHKAEKEAKKEAKAAAHEVSKKHESDQPASPTAVHQDETTSDLDGTISDTISETEVPAPNIKAIMEQLRNPPVPTEKQKADEVVIMTNAPTSSTSKLKNLEYPDWFAKAWSQSATAGQGNIFVGDNPLFPPCHNSKIKHLGKKYRMEEPRRWTSDTKNPCWYEKPVSKKDLRCLPYFYIAGVAKCGTTDMFYRLTLHPEMQKGSMKEYHWWDRYRFEALRQGSKKRGGLKDGPVTFNYYSKLITGRDALLKVAEDINMFGKSVKIFGDASPSYLWDMHHWDQLAGNEGCSEPRVVIGQHIHHVNPESKMILIFRHPTSRLYSRFLSRIPRTSYLKGSTADSFHEMVVKGVRMYRECFARWSIRHCAYNQTLRIDTVVRLTEGMYPVYMADWIRVFPKDKMLLLRTEDYGKNMTNELNKVFDFLGLSSVHGTPYEHDIFTVAAHNVGEMYKQLGPMHKDTEAILNDFYQPFIHKFAEILQDERYLWLDTVKKPQ